MIAEWSGEEKNRRNYILSKGELQLIACRNQSTEEYITTFAVSLCRYTLDEWTNGFELSHKDACGGGEVDYKYRVNVVYRT